MCRDIHTFLEIFGQKKCLFGSKTVFLGQEVHYYMVYIAYYIELNLQICDYAQKRRICRENCKYALDKNFHGHFCPPRKAAKFCHPGTRTVFLSWIFQNWRKMNVSANELSCCYYRHTIHKSAQSKNNCQPPTPKHKIKDSSIIF